MGNPEVRRGGAKTGTRRQLLQQAGAVAALVCLPGIERAAHLSAVSVPLLFLQGTRDVLADLELLRPICDELGAAATLHILEGADHGFHVLKRSGRTDFEVADELAARSANWAREIG